MLQVITSAEKIVKRKNRAGVETEISVLVWNPTVANLTLMALGSSAPEIMLAAIETMMNLGGLTFSYCKACLLTD